MTKFKCKFSQNTIIKKFVILFIFNQFLLQTGLAAINERQDEVYKAAKLFESYYPSNDVGVNTVDVTGKLTIINDLSSIYPVKTVMLNPAPANLDFKSTIGSRTGMTMVLSSVKANANKNSVVVNSVSGDKVLVFDSYKRSYYFKVSSGQNNAALRMKLDNVFLDGSTVANKMYVGDEYNVETVLLAKLDLDSKSGRSGISYQNYLKANGYEKNGISLIRDQTCDNAVGTVNIKGEQFYFQYAMALAESVKDGVIACRNLFTDGESKIDFSGTLKMSCQNGVVSVIQNNCGVMTMAGGHASVCKAPHATNAYWYLKTDESGFVSTEARCVADACESGYDLRFGSCVSKDSMHCQSVDPGNVTCLHNLMMWGYQGSQKLLDYVNSKTGYNVQSDPGWCAPTAAQIMHTAFVRERQKYKNIGSSPVVLADYSDPNKFFDQKSELAFMYMKAMNTDIKNGGSWAIIVNENNDSSFSYAGIITGLEAVLGAKYISYTKSDADMVSGVFRRKNGSTEYYYRPSVPPMGQDLSVFGISMPNKRREEIFLTKMPTGLLISSKHAMSVMGLEYSRYLKLKDPWLSIFDADIGEDHAGLVFSFGNEDAFDPNYVEMVKLQNGYFKQHIDISVDGYVDVQN